MSLPPSKMVRVILNTDAKNEADPTTYYSPLDNEDYQASLFGDYADTKDKAEAKLAEGDKDNALGDKLTLATVIMAVSLFLLGIGAVVSVFRVKLIMAGIGLVIFVVAAVVAGSVPWLPLFS